MSAGGTMPQTGGATNNPQPTSQPFNPSSPPVDYSMGYARTFQPPSFFNPFSGYYGANTGMGGFQSQFGGFQQPQFGGFGGFQQPQFGGGFGRSFFSRRFGPQLMPEQPPQMQPGMGLQPIGMPPPRPYDPSSQMPTIPFRGDTPTQPQQDTGPTEATGTRVGESRTFTGPNALIDGFNAMEKDRIARERQFMSPQPYMGGFNPMMGGIGGFGGYGGGFGNYGGFNPMMGGIGSFNPGMQGPGAGNVFGMSGTDWNKGRVDPSSLLAMG